MNSATLETELCQFLSAEVLRTEQSVGPDDTLAELGVDSFSLMELVLFVERRFGVVLPMDRLTPENTRSIRTLSACVAGATRGP